MAITNAVCNSFKTESLNGEHLAANTYKIALFTSAATLSKSTTAYSATNEVVGTNYVAGGATLAGRSVSLSGDSALYTWTSPTWAAATITARGAVIYNASVSNKALFVLDFGSDVTSTNDTFTVTLPANLLTET